MNSRNPSGVRRSPPGVLPEYVEECKVLVVVVASMVGVVLVVATVVVVVVMGCVVILICHCCWWAMGGHCQLCDGRMGSVLTSDGDNACCCHHLDDMAMPRHLPAHSAVGAKGRQIRYLAYEECEKVCRCACHPKCFGNGGVRACFVKS